MNMGRMHADKGFRQQDDTKDQPKEPALSPPNSSPSTPQKVVDRMFIRMVCFAAIPVVLGVLSLPVFIYLKNSNEDFPIWIVCKSYVSSIHFLTVYP